MMGAGPSGPAAARATEATATETTELQAGVVTPPPPPVEMMALKPQQQASDAGVAGSDTQGVTTSLEATVSKTPSDSGSNISNDGGASTSNPNNSDGTSRIRPRPIVTDAQLSNNSNSYSSSSDSSGNTRNKNKNNSSSLSTSNSTSEWTPGVNADGPGGSSGGANRGVIPRICDFLFERAEAVTAEANANTGVATAGPGEVGEVEGSTRAGDSTVPGVVGKPSGVSTRWTFR